MLAILCVFNALYRHAWSMWNSKTACDLCPASMITTQRHHLFLCWQNKMNQRSIEKNSHSNLHEHINILSLLLIEKKSERSKKENTLNGKLWKTFFFLVPFAFGGKNNHLPFKQNCCFFSTFSQIYLFFKLETGGGSTRALVFQTSLSPTHCVSWFFLMLFYIVAEAVCCF